MITEQHIKQLNTLVQGSIKEYKTKRGISKLTLVAMGYGITTGKLAITKSQSTWQYSFRQISPLLEYISRRQIRLKGVSVVTPGTIGLDIPMDKDLFSGRDPRPVLDTGTSTEHIDEFVANLPQDMPELGYKPKWGKFTKNEVYENAWNAPILAMLYFAVYGEYPMLSELIEKLKTVEFPFKSQINFSLGKPGKQNKYWSEEQWTQARRDFSNGLPAIKRDFVSDEVKEQVHVSKVAQINDEETFDV